MVNLNYVNIADVDIGIYKKGPIGVGVSCGADSALLLYVLMSNVKETVHVYNMMAEKRRPALEKYFYAVVEKCAELTGNNNYVIHQEIVESGESAEFYINMLTGALDKKEVDIIYLGLTKFPPKAVYAIWDGQQPEWHNEFRSDEVEHPLFGFTIPVEKATSFGEECPLTIDGNPIDELKLDERAYIPWFNHNKKDIARMYDSLGVTDTLFPVTRSCENDEHIGSHCGSCWWCEERLWAFGNLGN